MGTPQQTLPKWSQECLPSLKGPSGSTTVIWSKTLEAWCCRVRPHSSFWVLPPIRVSSFLLLLPCLQPNVAFTVFFTREAGPSWTTTTVPWDRSTAALEQFPSSCDSWMHSSLLYFPSPRPRVQQPAWPGMRSCGHAARRAQAQGSREPWSRARPWAALADRLSRWAASLVLGESSRQTSKTSIASVIMQYN